MPLEIYCSLYCRAMDLYKLINSRECPICRSLSHKRKRDHSNNGGKCAAREMEPSTQKMLKPLPLRFLRKTKIKSR